MVNQIGYHANIMGNVQRVYESAPGAPFAAPAIYFQDFDDPITGLSHHSNKPIVFTENECSRIEGSKGLNASGRTFVRKISDEFGCVANQTIVRTNRGLFFWSKTGICFTDGLRAVRVTEHLIERYAKWLSYVQSESGEIGPRHLRGTYDEINRRVLWSSLDELGQPIVIVLDVFEGISETMPIFMETGNTNLVYDNPDYSTVNMYQTSALFFSEDNNIVFRAQDKRLLSVSPELTYDEYWDGQEALKIPVRTSLKSIAFDYGDRSSRKWTAKIMYGFEDLGEKGVSLQPLGWNDLSKNSHKLAPMVNYQHMEWSANYANSPQLSLEQFAFHTDASWNSQDIVSYQRRFPRNKIRNVFKQVGFEPLPYELGQIANGQGNVTDVRVTYKSGTSLPLVLIDIDVSDTLDNALIDLDVDASGSFYVRWSGQDELIKVHNFSLDTNTYTLQVFDGDIVSSDFTYTDVEEITVARLFSDQRIKLSDYTMTFKGLGDKTQGLYRTTQEGGDNGQS